MSSQILRPTKVKGEKGEWLIRGPWGKRKFNAQSKMTLYRQLRLELITSGLLSPDARVPSNNFRYHVTSAVMSSSWIEDRWVPDESFAVRLKTLRVHAKLTQEQLAEQSGLDVGTIRQLEQGTRTNPSWQTVCALARGFGKDISVFAGTDGWQPPEAPEE